MRSRPPHSLASLLWQVLRVGARTLWQSPANPARPLLARQEALAVLGLPPHASAQQIKRRYRALAQRYHPDRGGDLLHMQRLSAAYTFLTKEHPP